MSAPPNDADHGRPSIVLNARTPFHVMQLQSAHPQPDYFLEMLVRGFVVIMIVLVVVLVVMRRRLTRSPARFSP